MVLLGMEALAAAERKPGRGAGIVTLRRQPPRMHVARQPRARPPPRMAPPPPSWQDVQNRNHAFYQLGMKAKIDAAQAVAVGEPGGDALDAALRRGGRVRLPSGLGAVGPGFATTFETTSPT